MARVKMTDAEFIAHLSKKSKTSIFTQMKKDTIPFRNRPDIKQPQKHRKTETLGVHYRNKGTVRRVDAKRYVLDNSRSYYVFDITPMGGVRMTDRDRYFLNPDHPDPKKRQRPAVTKYFQFKNTLTAQAKAMNFEIKGAIEAVYVIPMPDSWSDKKKAEMNGMPHLPKPDCDNITKAIKDTLKKNDSDIWFEEAQKRWGYKGSIILFEIE